ncbi:restriction endonuclease subunit S [uncultured Parabacteroides sp.]|uniref:restriction endonuclease subunit S n=1 Tax=uncultured Parabacteroides sp. TaxID=512312 RepID=UPI0026F14DBA|nr:restriction endonuclease subunit S [uncultured Parabacteroides sp.]
MKIPQGYKQTELGIIPEDWEIVELGRGLSFQVGFPFVSNYFNVDAIGLRLVRNRDLKADDQILYYSGQYKTEYVVRNGDVLVGMDGDFLPCLWRKGYALLNQRVGRIIVRNDWNPKFLFYLLFEPLLHRQEETGATTVKHLSHKDIERMQLPIPSLIEQKSIAQALSDVDALIAVLDKKIAKKRLIKQGVMQYFASKKLLNEKVRIGELGKWGKGQSFSKEQILPNGKYKCIHYGELFGYNEVIDRIKSTTNTQPIKKSSGRDILFPASDVTPIGLGRCSALQSNDILLGGDIIILELKNEYAPAYISYIINQNKQQIINRVTGTTVKHINSRQLSEIIIEITKNKKEQMVIATILSDMDKEIVDLEARRDKYKLIKSGMMQKLLTGQIRLI